MSKESIRLEKEKAIESLKGYVKNGDTVYTVLNHCSASGMTRHISMYVALISKEGRPYIYSITYLCAKALEYKRHRDDGGLIVGGCGMDMGFDLVNSLQYALFGLKSEAHLRHEWL